MAAKQLTDKLIRNLPAPKSGVMVYRDAKVKGLGVRVLPSATRSFVLDYTSAGRRRIHTIGRYPEWKIGAARAKAAELKSRIRYDGFDPAGQLKAGRDAETVADLIERFQADHLPKLRLRTRQDYERVLHKDISSLLGKRKVADVHFADIERLHRQVTERGATVEANKYKAVASKLFAFAIERGLIDRNPAKGVKLNASPSRQRYLKAAEIAALSMALADHPDQNVADLIRLLLLTGARRGETSSARWQQFDLSKGIWTKPAASTKQNREHVVPLAAPALELLSRRWAQAEAELKRLGQQISKARPSERPALQDWKLRVEAFVFPSADSATGHIVEIKKPWWALCKKAGIVTRKEIIDPKTGRSRVIERHSARIHDLRHTAASILASGGASLPLIGQLLGHTQAATTQRYAHLFDEAQRAAVERLGATIAGMPSAEVIEIGRGRR